MKKYKVFRTSVYSDYTTVTADSDIDAIGKAKELAEEYWQENPDEYLVSWDYEVEEITN